MSTKLKAIIIDDEPFAIEGLKALLIENSDLEFVRSFENPLEAIVFLKTEKIDLMFLDIEMPELSGLDLLRSLETPPVTIITSANPQYALEGFELDVLDYLVKPISGERLTKAVSKAKEYIELRKNSSTSTTYLFLKCEKVIEKIMLEDILYIESLHNYVALHTKMKRYVTYNSLKKLEAELPEGKFVKIQKSFIVAINKISAVEDSHVLIEKVKLPISRSKKDEVLAMIRKG
ncbi:MAG: response regulator transcription factor [Sphingobacteriaceae bacterium]|nr:response regulator transcription factor [Sphingobacteriaceae bacterium]